MSASSTCTSAEAVAYVLRYQSLSRVDRVLLFPCDAAGRVQMDGLSRRELNNYLFARATVGFEFGAPHVLCDALH
jgi:hypothetical protein